MTEIVYVVVNGNVGVRSPYHTDEDCRLLQQADEYRERNLDQVPHRHECVRCAGEFDPYAGDDETHICDCCGREYGTENGLSRHILREHPDVVERKLGSSTTVTASTRKAIADD